MMMKLGTITRRLLKMHFDQDICRLRNYPMAALIWFSSLIFLTTVACRSDMITPTNKNIFPFKKSLKYPEVSNKELHLLTRAEAKSDVC